MAKTCLIWLLAVIVAGAALAQESPKESPVFVIVPEASEVPLGSSIKIDIQIKNTTRREIDASIHVDADRGIAPAYGWDVRDSAGHVVPVKPRKNPWAGEVWFRKLAPGESLTDSANMSLLYDFDQPGKYTFQAFWRTSQQNPPLSSNRATVTVTKAKQ